MKMSYEEKLKQQGNYSIMSGSSAYPSSNNENFKYIDEKAIGCTVFGMQMAKEVQ